MIALTTVWPTLFCRWGFDSIRVLNIRESG
jgi:hypothetical protein